VWDVDSGTRTAEPLYAPDASHLIGFTADGYLVTSNDTSDALQLWDLGRGRLSGTVPLGGRFADPRDPVDPLLLSTFGGMPGRLPLTAQVWADQLCATVDGDTDAEVRALPAGTQDRRPCP
jgi:hypothetical protein